jgi:hypothetical protein
MTRKRKPNSGDPRKDQVDAAARDARQQIIAGGPLGGLLDLTQARVSGPENANPGVAKLAARMRQAFTTTRLDACEHVERIGGSGSAIPVHWAAWRPDRAACTRCFAEWLAPASGEERCDLCGSKRPTDYVQVVRGIVTAHADICDQCQGK